MGTSTIILVLVGNFIFEPAISAAIDYEPIHITVNENYNTQPGYGSQGLQSPDTAIVHQGANFYFKPQLNIRPNFIPSHIEALMSVLTQHPNSCSKNDSKLTVDKDKLIEILKPFMHVQNQNNIPAPEVMVDGPVLPPLALADVLSATGEDVKLEEQSISHKPASTFPQIPEILAKPEITVINTEHKPIIADFSAIPEAPVLPPLVLDNIPSTIGQEIKLEEQLFSQPPTEIYPTIPEILSKPEITIINTENKPITSEFSIIPEAPILPPLVLENIASVIGEEVKSENQLISEKNTGSYPAISVLPSLPEAIAVHTELKPVSSESAIIPEAPVLPPLVFNNIPSAIVEEIKLEEQSNSEKHTGVYPTISVIPSQPIEVHSDTKPFTPEFPIIPDAPVLPPLALDDISSANGEDINLEEQLITQKPISVFPEVSELLAKPEITVINTEPKPITAEFSTIPEAPVLPPLALDKIPFSIGEEVKLEEQLISEKNTGVHTSISGPPFEPTAIHSESNYFTPGFPIIPEAPLLPPPPVLPPLVLDNRPSAISEDIKMEEQLISEAATSVYPTIPELPALPKPIAINTEPKPFISEFSAIPEAPVLPPLVIDDIPAYIGEEIKLEEQLISEAPTSVYPTIPEIPTKPEITVINTENKPIIPELAAIPEAPVLPPLVLPDLPSTFGDGEILEEQIISDNPTSVFPKLPELLVKPQITVINTENKPITPALPAIPEAPVLPPLILNNIQSAMSEEVKMEEHLISAEHTTEPKIPEILSEPAIAVINTENKPITPELSAIPEAPVLPPLVFNNIQSAISEEVKMEEHLISAEHTTEPKIPEILSEPAIAVINTENKPITPELSAIPEAPVLPPLIFNNIQSAISEEVKMEEHLISAEHTTAPKIPEILSEQAIAVINTENKPITPELSAIPEAPVLPPLVIDDIPAYIGEEIKLEEQLISEAASGVYPTISEILTKPEITVISTENKPITPELSAIPEAPVLPPLILNNIQSAINEEVKMEEHLISAEHTAEPKIPEIVSEPAIAVINTENKPITPELSAIPEAPVLPPLVIDDIPAYIGEEIKLEEQLISEAASGVYPTISEILTKPEITVISTENKPITPELSAIPEAPVLPPLILNNIQSAINEEVKMEEYLISAEHTAEPKIPEIVSEPAIAVINTENKPITPELSEIPEAPVLPPLVINDIPAYIGEEIKLEEQLISEAASGVYPPTIPEILTKPEITVINTENKPITPELSAIPEAPVLPPLVLNKIPAAIREEFKVEEQIISKEHSGVYPTIPAILTKPEITVINTENKSITPELSAIPEAPVLPQLVLDNIPADIGEEFKVEEKNISKEHSGVYPTLPEILTKPEITVINTENKPITPELLAIPEAPVLPPLVLDNIPADIGEEFKVEEQIISKEHAGVYPTISEILTKPEITVITTETKPITPELSAIPEAPVLPPLVLENIPSTIGEVKLEEPLTLGQNTEIIINNEDKVESPDATMIPEAPQLSPFSWSNGRPDFREIELEETIEFEKSIQEISRKPVAASDKVDSFELMKSTSSPKITKNEEPAQLGLEELKEVFSIRTPQFSDSFVLKEVSRPNRYNVGRDIVIKKTPSSAIISRPGSRQGIFSFAPFISPFSQRVLKKKVMIPKSASLEHFLLKKHPFILPIVPSPKLTLKAKRLPKSGKKNQFLYSTSCAQNIVKERIAPSMFLNKLRKYINFK